MEAKWSYLILSGVWIAAGIFNICDHRPLPVLIFNFSAALIFLGLFIAKIVCSKKGKEGDRIMKRILWIALAVVLMGMIVPVLLSLVVH